MAELKDSDRGLPASDARATGFSREPSVTALDIFRRASGLGGMLVVALVAPLPARNGFGLRDERLAAASRKSRERDENDQKLLKAGKAKKRKTKRPYAVKS